MRFSVVQATALLALLTTVHGLNINRFIESGDIAIRGEDKFPGGEGGFGGGFGGHRGEHDHDGHRGGHDRDNHGHGRHGSHNHFRRDEDVDDGFRESSSAWGTSTKIEDDGGFGGRGGLGRGRDHDKFPGGFGGFGHGFGGYRRAEESEDKFPIGFGGFGGHRGGHDHDHGRHGHHFGGYRRAEESEDKFPGGFGGFGGHRDHHKGDHRHGFFPFPFAREE